MTVVTKNLKLTFEDPVAETLMTYTATVNSWIGDITSSWLVVLIFGMILPIILGFLFIVHINVYNSSL